MNALDIPAALPHAFELQRASYDAAPFPEWDVRRDRLQRLQRLIVRQRDRDRSRDRRRLRRAAAHGDPDRRDLSEPGRDQGRAAPRRAVDAAARRLGVEVVPAGARPRDAAAARRGRHHRAVELPAVPGDRAAGRCAGRRQPRDGEDVRVHAGVLAAVRRTGAQVLRAPTRSTSITGGPDVAAQFSALPFDHLLFTGSTARRPPRDGRGRAEPDAGHAGTRRQVADGRRAGLLDRARGAARPGRQAAQRRADVHRTRLRARATRAAARTSSPP